MGAGIGGNKVLLTESDLDLAGDVAAIKKSLEMQKWMLIALAIIILMKK
jgi:hypothetical protein